MALTFGIRSSALPDNAKVAAFRGSEGLSRPYTFDVYVNVAGDEELDLEDGVGARGTLTIDGGGPEPVQIGGVVSSMQLLRAVRGNALYLVRIVPLLWQLSLTRHSRMFTKMSIPDVIKAVLAAEGIDDFELRLSGSYDTEEHVCQYKESSLDFIQRWMEREGMYYFFEQTDSGEKLVITDDKARHQLAPGVLPIPYHPSEADRSAGKSFDYFAARHHALPSKIKLSDYDYGKPALDVSGSATVSSSGFGEVRHYGNRVFSPDMAAKIAKVRAEELRAKATTYHATGFVAGLAPGFKFVLEQHTKLALNKPYLTTSIEHFGFVADVAGPWGKVVPHEYDEVYRVDLQALDAEQQYRHAETVSWPRIDGYENANVDGAATSDYAQIDSHGRYNVKFKFDEGTLKDGKATTWVRMMQPHGGSPEGFHFPLRKGTEVLCAFLGGDPDRPVIIGVVPNAITPSKVTASNYTQNMIHTGGNNYITIEDLSGSQFINIFCPINATNLYLGVDRPIGGNGPTLPDGPEVPPVGEYKQDLKPFNFGLCTKGSGEVTATKNINVIAGEKLQLEGQGGGVYMHAKGEHKTHVEGTTEEHRTDKVWHKWDAEVDLDWKGKYTLDVQEESEIHFHNTLTQVTQSGTTVSDVANLYHAIGAEAEEMCPADTHFLDVTGTQKIVVSSDQTVNVEGKQTMTVAKDQKITVEGGQVWETGKDVKWDILGELNIEVTGPHEIKSATWHENVWGAKSELVGGWKNDMVLGAHTETDVGLKTEIAVALMLEANVGIKFEFEGALKVKMNSLDAGECELKHCGFVSKLDTVANWVGCKGLSILTGMKII